jgi:DNA-binding FadR family transcriptional regulator
LLSDIAVNSASLARISARGGRFCAFGKAIMSIDLVPDLAPPPEIRREPLSQKLYREIGERISRGEFAVGAKLPTEKELGSSYGVSRAVVREAISSLKADGMVRPQQGIGVFVLGPRSVPYPITPSKLASLKEAIDLLELRICVECEAAALAAIRCTREELDAATAAIDGMDRAVHARENDGEWDIRFHRAVAAMTGNSRFQTLFDMFGEQLLPRTRFGVGIADAQAMRDYLVRINLEHRAVLAAIARRDPDTARAAMRIHLSNVQVRLRAAYAAQA